MPVNILSLKVRSKLMPQDQTNKSVDTQMSLSHLKLDTTGTLYQP